MMFNELRDLLLQNICDYMQEYGFTPDEAAEYCYVAIKPGQDYWCVEVRAELPYEAMVELSEILDPIVQQYDNDAYFDMVEPGIMEACLMNPSIEASTKITADYNYRYAFENDRDYLYYIVGVVGRAVGKLRNGIENLSDKEVDEGIKLFENISKSLKNYTGSDF